MRFATAVLWGLNLSVFCFADGGAAATEPTKPTSRASAPTTMQAEAVAERPERADVKAALQMIDAGDPRIVPTLLWWLATEQDTPMVGSGSARLREAIRGARELRIKEAAPWLMSGAGNQGFVDLAATTAMLVDPEGSIDFAREQFEHGRFQLVQHAAPVVAAMVLVETQKDEAARAFLMEGYRGALNDRAAGRTARNVFATELARSAEASLRDGVLQLAAHYSPEVRKAAQQLAEQMRMNALSAAELAGICEDSSKDSLQQEQAMLALAWHGTPDVLPRLDKLAPPQMVPTTGAEARLNDRITPAVSAAAIRRRFRLGKVQVDVPHASVPAVAAAPEAHPVTWGDAEGIVMHCAGVSVDPNVADPTPYVALTAYDGSTPTMRLQAADGDILKQSRSLDYDGLVMAQLSGDEKKVLSMRPLDPQPGELTREGYVLVELCRVTDRQTQRAAVRLSKFGRQFIARIPNRTGANGATVSDSTLMHAAERIKPGDVVEARFEESKGLTMLSWIAPYRPAVRAIFVRRLEVRQGEAMAAGIEVKLGGKQRTFVLPPQQGMRKPSLDETMLGALMPGSELMLTSEDEVMREGGVRPLLRDVRIEGVVSWRRGQRDFFVRARRASWNSKSTLQLNWRDEESPLLRTALAKFNADETNALAFAPDTVAALKQAFQVLEKVNWDAVRKDLAPLSVAYMREGNPEKQSALEQQMLLGLQRFVVEFDAKAEEQRSMVKKILNPEQYKALLTFGARPLRR